MKHIITRELLIQKIKALLLDKITLVQFGNEMLDYLTKEGEKYEYESGSENIIEATLREFMDIHDVNEKDLKYTPYIPNKERFKQIIHDLENNHANE